MELDDILKTLNDAGFKPVANVDEDFPAIRGEYAVNVKTARPFFDKESKALTAYLLTVKIANTLNGDVADNREFSRFYRIAGEVFGENGQRRPITPAEVAESMKKMGNDAATLGVTISFKDQGSMETSFAQLVDKAGWVRAWHFSPKNEPDRKVQQWKIKLQKDLQKESKATASGATARAPF